MKNSILLFWKNQDANSRKKIGRILVVVSCVGILGFIGYAVFYHRAWFEFPFGKYLALKVFLKSGKWLVVALGFWLGKQYFSKNNNNNSEPVQTNSPTNNQP